MSVIKASVVQTCTQGYGTPQCLELTLKKLDELAGVAKQRDGSQFAVFPEAFIGGYPCEQSFGAVVGARTASPEGLEGFKTYYNQAIEVPSAATDKIAAIAKKHNMFLVVGVIERVVGTLYCCAIFVHPTKGLLGKHRKLVPTAAERLVWGYGDATTLPVLEETFTTAKKEEVSAKISATICWENYMPLLRTFYYSKGVQIYCAPTVDSRPVWQHTMINIAHEGRCYVLAPCQFAQQRHYPEGYPIGPNKADPEGVMIAGGSVIIDPQGVVLAGPLRGEEGVLSADIDLDEYIKGKFDMDTTGHYARHDIFELKVKGLPE